MCTNDANCIHGDKLDEQTVHLREIADLLRGRNLPNLERMIYISAAPTTLNTFNRRHMVVFVPAPLAVSFGTLTPGTTINLVAGWNVLDLPDGTQISTAATATNALLRLTDDDVTGLI